MVSEPSLDLSQIKSNKERKRGKTIKTCNETKTHPGAFKKKKHRSEKNVDGIKEKISRFGQAVLYSLSFFLGFGECREGSHNNIHLFQIHILFQAGSEHRPINHIISSGIPIK